MKKIEDFNFEAAKKDATFQALEYTGEGKDRTCKRFLLNGREYYRAITERVPVSGEVLRIRSTYVLGE